MVVARSVRAYHSLVYALAQRDVTRLYRTLVWGHLANPNGVIDAPIGRDHRDPMRMAVVVDGKSARTRYQVARRVSRSGRGERAGVPARVRTYPPDQGPPRGDRSSGRRRRHVWRHPPRDLTPRPFLHAAELEFDHPSTNEPMSFTSPLPDDLAAVEAQLTT